MSPRLRCQLYGCALAASACLPLMAAGQAAPVAGEPPARQPSEPAAPPEPPAGSALPGEVEPEAPSGLIPPSRTPDALPPSAAGEAAGRGPEITLPPELASEQPPPEKPPLVAFGTEPGPDTLSRGLGPERMRRPSTVIGGYGQFNLTALRVGPADENDFNARANLRRLVLFVAHPLTDRIHVYSEFEWENAIACDGCVGSVEVEQAFLEWQLLGQALALRAGLVLIPMGIVNQWHEPPVFHGVDRPQVDTLVIPTTWRELGLGFTGTLAEAWHYELYVTTTLDPLQLDASGIGPARTLGSFAKANALAVSGRIEFEPLLGLITGASFFASDLGGNGDYFSRSGRERDLTLPLIGYALDARIRRFGLEARVVWSQFFFPNAGDLLAAFRDDGSPLFPNVDATGPIAERIEGGYLELAYNPLFWVETGQELLGFVRLEIYDTQAGVPARYEAEPELDVDEYTFGITYRPIPQLVFKGDVQLRDRRLGLDELQLNAGFGYMF